MASAAAARPRHRHRRMSDRKMYEAGFSIMSSWHKHEIKDTDDWILYGPGDRAKTEIVFQHPNRDTAKAFSHTWELEYTSDNEDEDLQLAPEFVAVIPLIKEKNGKFEGDVQEVNGGERVEESVKIVRERDVLSVKRERGYYGDTYRVTFAYDEDEPVLKAIYDKAERYVRKHEGSEEFPLTISCAACGTTATHKCAGCNDEFYCSEACQADEWHAGHKNICARIDM